MKSISVPLVPLSVNWWRYNSIPRSKHHQTDEKLVVKLSWTNDACRFNSAQNDFWAYDDV
ncbi:unnamed protein product [Amoebophrya sp. A25]|nr:unnamed protein product [Amoebophrya sp. A25]|eukprot:GSA25T00006164001.1